MLFANSGLLLVRKRDPANVYIDRKINLKGYCLLAADWAGQGPFDGGLSRDRIVNMAHSETVWFRWLKVCPPVGW